jgi:hypothetical protein
MGNPAAQIYFNAAGRKGGLALWFWPILIQFFMGITACFQILEHASPWHEMKLLLFLGMFIHLPPQPSHPCRLQRLTLSRRLRQMNSYTRTPLYSVWAVVSFCRLLNLVALGSVQTINGIFGVTAPAMDLSYIAIVAARMWYAKKKPITPGPFTLGRWQKPIIIIAIVWVLFICHLVFPACLSDYGGEYELCSCYKWVYCAFCVGVVVCWGQEVRLLIDRPSLNALY